MAIEGSVVTAHQKLLAGSNLCFIWTFRFVVAIINKQESHLPQIGCVLVMQRTFFGKEPGNGTKGQRKVKSRKSRFSES